MTKPLLLTTPDKQREEFFSLKNRSSIRPIVAVFHDFENAFCFVRYLMPEQLQEHNNLRYAKFKREYLRLSRRDKNVPFKNISAKTESKIIIYTEGPTDPPILKAAWQKLYQDSILLIITAVEIKPGIATGATASVDELSTHRKQHGIVIGIFDRDTEGIRACKSLHSEFEEKDGFKVSVDRNAAAILLPIPAGNEKVAEPDKLWIENYFSETVLNMKTDDEKVLSSNMNQ